MTFHAVNPWVGCEHLPHSEKEMNKYLNLKLGPEANVHHSYSVLSLVCVIFVHQLINSRVNFQIPDVFLLSQRLHSGGV
jgi:hypothetical protein